MLAVGFCNQDAFAAEIDPSNCCCSLQNVEPNLYQQKAGSSGAALALPAA
jgi:hypothetical protein